MWFTQATLNHNATSPGRHGNKESEPCLRPPRDMKRHVKEATLLLNVSDKDYGTNHGILARRLGIITEGPTVILFAGLNKCKSHGGSLHYSDCHLTYYLQFPPTELRPNVP